MPVKRGRKLGTGRKLNQEQEVELCNIIFKKRPWQVGIKHSPRQSLWCRDSVIELIQLKCGISLSSRGLAKYLRRWGFPSVKHNQRPIERCTWEIQEWLAENLEQLRTKKNTKIFYLNRERMNFKVGRKHKNLALITAIDNHRKEYWMVVKGDFTREKQITFLNSLINQTRQHIVVIRRNSDHYTNHEVRYWLSTNCDKIELFPPLLLWEVQKQKNDLRRATGVLEELKIEKEMHQSRD